MKKIKQEALKSKTRSEMLQQGIIRKKECELKALHFVQTLALTDKVDKDQLREIAKYINPSYYDDVVEERSIGSTCGFPLCSNQIDHKFSQSQQFHISIRYKKVFDVTDRKKFCSNECFKSSSVFKEQLLTSPLWLREDDEIPPVVFYDEKKSKKQSSTDVHRGYEVEFQNESAEILREIRRDANGNADQSFRERTEDDSSDEECHSGEEQKYDEDLDSVAEDLADDFRDSLTLKNTTKVVRKPAKPNVKSIEKSLEVKETIEKSRDFKKEHGVGKSRLKDDSQKVPTISKVAKFMEEWYTIETLRLLHGEQFLRKLLLENDLAAPELVEVDSYLGNSSGTITPEVRARYIRLCRQLDLQEILEMNEDKTAVGHTDLKKLPDFEQLKKDAQIQNLKVVSFLKGAEDIKLEEKATETEKEMVTSVPVIDKHAQDALRRRIVTDQLDRVLTDLLRLFGLLRRDLNTGLQKLVKSFKFGPENITMNSDEWTLVAIIILRMLCLNDERLRVELTSEASEKYFNLMLLDHGVDLKWIEAFILSLNSDLKATLGKLSL